MIENTQNWTSKQDAMNYFHITAQTIENFIKEVKANPNNFNIKTDFDIKKGGYRNLEVYYSDNLLKQFQDWLKANQLNQGRQTAAKADLIREYGDNNMIENTNNEQWYSKVQICGMCNTDEKTFRRFIKNFGLDIDVHSKIINLGGHNNTTFYSPEVLKQFQDWLKANQLNQGHQTAAKEEVKKDYVQGIVAIEYINQLRELGYSLTNDTLNIMAIEKEKQNTEKEKQKTLRLENKGEVVKCLKEEINDLTYELSRYKQIQETSDKNTICYGTYIVCADPAKGLYKIGTGYIPNRVTAATTYYPDGFWMYYKSMPDKFSAEEEERKMFTWLKEYPEPNKAIKIGETEVYMLDWNVVTEIVKAFNMLQVDVTQIIHDLQVKNS